MSQLLIESLQNSELFDHPITNFTVLETHISWVLLTGQFAYKIKKPYNFGFLDFSTLEKRQYFCQEELRLNRRLAPDLYLELVPIGGSETQPQLSVAPTEAIEFSIKMVQFDQNELAEALLKRGEFSTDTFCDLAKTVAEFHQQIDIAPDERSWGQAAEVMFPIRQNFEQIRPFLSEEEDLRQLEFLQAWAEDSYQRLKNQLNDRKNLGFIRECHGDLHLGNITRFQGKITLFDCIEFNESFRWIDVINDVAFLLMDLEHRQLPVFAHAFINRYLEVTGDYAGMALMQFYKSYRALVRAKVALFGLQDSMSNEQKSAIYDLYRSYANLAESYTRAHVPELILMHGYSGTGKSWLSSKVLETTGAIRLRSDVERKRLMGADSPDLYSEQAGARTFAYLQKLTLQLLQSGFDVIVDATFLKSQHRIPFIKLAEGLGMGFHIICCEAGDEMIRQRLKARQADGRDISDADIEVYELQRANSSDFSEEELPFCIRLDTSKAQQVDSLLARFQVSSESWSPAPA